MQKNLFKKFIQFEYTISTAICEDVFECVSIKLLRNYRLLIYIYIYIYMKDNLFINELRENSYKKLMEYETKAIEMSDKTNTSYSDIKK
jgi:hypothetical protein